MKNLMVTMEKQQRHLSVLSAVAFLLGIVACSGSLNAQDTLKTSRVLRAVADSVIQEARFRFVDRETGRRFESLHDVPAGVRPDLESGYNDWRYWNGVLNLALLRVGETLKEPAYIRYVQNDIAFDFDSYEYFERLYAGQEKWTYPFAQRFTMKELDDYGAMAASVIEVYRRVPDKRYLSYLNQAAAYAMTKQNRLEDRTFVRAFPSLRTLWADDLYMSVSFLSRLGELTGDSTYLDDAAQQVINFHKHLFDDSVGLMHHNWYAGENTPGTAFWGRANGWTLLAQVDLLDRLPANHPKRQVLLGLLRRHLLGIARYQNGEGLWHQLIDKSDSFLETSCSAMFTYAMARAVDKGYIERRYASVALRGWEGVLTRIREDAKIEGVCAGTGIADDLVYYYHRPTPLNDPHGIGPVLLAGSEILNLVK
jgi:unsaturated rhamnogalacturonyl hydrolase